MSYFLLKRNLKAGLTAPTWYAKNDEYRTKNLYFKSYFYYPAKANNQKEASMFNKWGKGRSKSCTNTSKKNQRNFANFATYFIV